MSWLRSTWQQLATHSPSLHRDGISLPAPLLQQQLGRLLDSPRLTVNALALADGKGTLTLDLHQPVRHRLIIHFRFGAIDWPRRRLPVLLTLEGHSLDERRLHRHLATLAQHAAGSTSGQTLLAYWLKDCPWATLQPGQLDIHLDALPGLADLLNLPLGTRTVADRWQLAELAILPGTLRLHLSRTPPTHQG